MKRYSPFLTLLLSAITAEAHPAIFHGQGAGAAAQAGFLHPLTGFDHLLVMVAVGLWAVQIGGRALWLLPCTFVASMIAGGLVGLSGFHAPIAESGILASMILLGAALGMVWRPQLWIASLFVALSGLCHGYAHGSEMQAGLVPSVYFAGMVLATSLLHAAGVGSGLMFRRSPFLLATRVAGLLILAFALYDFLSPVS